MNSSGASRRPQTPGWAISAPSLLCAEGCTQPPTPPRPSVPLSPCPRPVPLCLDHGEGQGTPASSTPPHYPSANSPTDALHLLLGSQAPSRCRPANGRAASERKAPARPPAAPSASQKQGQSLSAFHHPCDRCCGAREGAEGTGVGGGEPCGRPHRYHAHGTPSPPPPRQALPWILSSVPLCHPHPHPHTESLNMLPAPATPAKRPNLSPLPLPGVSENAG